MHVLYRFRRSAAVIGVIVIGIAVYGIVAARAASQASSKAGHEQDVTDLKFRDMFRMPIGPRGLEPTEKLQSLGGKRVRMVGYMVKDETLTTADFILSPFPVTVGDEDESLSDDLPPSVVFVHVGTKGNHPAQLVPGLISVTGVLSVGAHEESSGRVSSVRLLLDPEGTHELSGSASDHSEGTGHAETVPR